MWQGPCAAVAPGLCLRTSAIEKGGIICAGAGTGLANAAWSGFRAGQGPLLGVWRDHACGVPARAHPADNGRHRRLPQRLLIDGCRHKFVHQLPAAWTALTALTWLQLRVGKQNNMDMLYCSHIISRHAVQQPHHEQPAHQQPHVGVHLMPRLCPAEQYCSFQRLPPLPALKELGVVHPDLQRAPLPSLNQQTALTALHAARYHVAGCLPTCLRRLTLRGNERGWPRATSEVRLRRWSAAQCSIGVRPAVCWIEVSSYARKGCHCAALVQEDSAPEASGKAFQTTHSMSATTPMMVCGAPAGSGGHGGGIAGRPAAPRSVLSAHIPRRRPAAGAGGGHRRIAAGLNFSSRIFLRIYS